MLAQLQCLDRLDRSQLFLFALRDASAIQQNLLPIGREDFVLDGATMWQRSAALPVSGCSMLHGLNLDSNFILF